MGNKYSNMMTRNQAAQAAAQSFFMSAKEMMDAWKMDNSGGDIISHRYKKPKVEYWQVRIVYNNSVQIRKGLFKKETLNIPFEFSAPYLNTTKEEAAGYAKYFLNDLINSGDLPKEVVVNGQVDDKLIKIAVVKLEVAYMERDVSDK